jgi:hypothetical protein
MAKPIAAMDIAELTSPCLHRSMDGGRFDRSALAGTAKKELDRELSPAYSFRCSWRVAVPGAARET